MKVSTQEICEFATTQPSHKNFIGAEDILEAGHLIKCGLQDSDTSCDNAYKIIAFCLQTSHLKDPPHEIVGAISRDGKIMGMSCSCKAGLGENCKHVVATLLYCNRNAVEKLQPITCTDKKCTWSAPQKAALEKYEPKPLREHDCFQLKVQKNLEAPGKKHQKKNGEPKVCMESIKLTKEENEELLKIMLESLHSSALKEHIDGRHDVLETACNNSTCDLSKVQAIFENQLCSKFLNDLEQVKVKPIKECCQKIVAGLNGNVVDICVKTMEFYPTWLEERRFRITGSDSYQLFTYRKNKNPDWCQKSKKYFYPDSVNNAYTQHGLKNEPLARNLYDESEPSMTVVECGLVVCEKNPWLAYSPDGVVFDKNNKPIKLIEIKCPYNGKKQGLQEKYKIELCCSY